ncbi:S-adenosyl-L-methionine-dependent methyltransferase [Penicillium concentricum]|uniref:S-adenosyl-L-methionine-dependent methyltransferase n=1 Tax=Penicillium concentricum TaxID=293559 RepID=A0A9W9RV75_9EURO|nr:S-adenosyl-L-methionine-dependent methyltransferase [Penicillium concentricum]KAJ5365629.1 S-adenosyl-L-methionine-dependent methyltransferase [Penicillium concentricum]
MSHDFNGLLVDTVNRANLLSLAEDITQMTKEITEYLQSNGCPQPTLSADYVGHPETVEYTVLYGKLKNSLEDLLHLVRGPKRHVWDICCEGYELAAIQVALQFKFFEIVPLEDQISIEALAEKAGVDLDRTRRIVRLLVTKFIFEEPTQGYIKHNTSSYLLHVDEEIRSTMQYTMDEMFKAASATADNVMASPLKYDSALTPFCTRHGMPPFKFYEKDTQRSIRFAKAMAGWSKLNLNLNALKESFPWNEIKGTVVDVGGGSGKVSITLAQSFPDLKFIVQDTVDMHAAGQSLLTDQTKDQVSFMQHNFFDPQPVGDAAAFLLRMCALNWCDRDVVAIFRALVPGLERSEPTTPLLINDVVLPPHGTLTRNFNRGLRQADVLLMVIFGGKLRTQSEFAALLKEADERYEIRNFYPEEFMGLLEVYLLR